jgi:hypothetical protein
VSVSISEIIAGASVHAVPLAGECAGYLVLSAADQAVAAPRRIGPREVHLFGDGTVRVDGAHAAAETDSEADLRALLDALLMSASSATPALLRASRRASGRGIAALVREIETALIPVNRAAANRALARLERETERARHAGRLEAVPLPVTNRSEEPKAVLPPVRTPEPSAAEPSPASEPKASSDPSELLLAALPEIPSLLTPSVDAIAAYAAEIETRPEPIVVRKSTQPPPRTPSPPPLPVASARRSPPPLPVVEAPPTTPVFGTMVQSHSDDEMDIEVVFDDDLVEDEELTGVLVRSAPLEVSAMVESPAAAEVSVPIDLTEPCPPALDDESDADASAISVEPEGESILAHAVEEPPPAEEPLLAVEPPPVEEALLAEESPPAEEPLLAVEPPPVEEPLLAEESPPAEEPLLAEEPPPAEESPREEELLLAVESPPAEESPSVVEPPPVIESLLAELLVAEASPDELFAFEAPPAPPEIPAVQMPDETADLPPVEATMALALGIEPVVELPPAPLLPLPKPRRSDVEDLLERMAQANAGANDELRSSLKGLAGIEPTPPPPAHET